MEHKMDTEKFLESELIFRIPGFHKQASQWWKEFFTLQGRGPILCAVADILAAIQTFSKRDQASQWWKQFSTLQGRGPILWAVADILAATDTVETLFKIQKLNHSPTTMEIHVFINEFIFFEVYLVYTPTWSVSV